MIACSAAGIVACTWFGILSGVLVTGSASRRHCEPGVMLVRGAWPYIVSSRQSIDQIPSAFNWLGIGTTLMAHSPIRWC